MLYKPTVRDSVFPKELPVSADKKDKGQEEKQKHREVKRFAQGHMAHLGGYLLDGFFYYLVLLQNGILRHRIMTTDPLFIPMSVSLFIIRT